MPGLFKPIYVEIKKKWSVEIDLREYNNENLSALELWKCVGCDVISYNCWRVLPCNHIICRLCNRHGSRNDCDKCQNKERKIESLDSVMTLILKDLKVICLMDDCNKPFQVAHIDAHIGTHAGIY